MDTCKYMTYNAMVQMARLMQRKGYVRIVNTNPSKALIEKLKKLGWKPGQCVYSDWSTHEMRFFDDKKKLEEFLQEKIAGPLTWDDMADIELKLDRFERRR